MNLNPRQIVSREWGQRAPRSICSCGHSGDGVKSQHDDSITVGHGICRVEGCPCHKFAWSRYTDLFQARLNCEEK